MVKEFTEPNEDNVIINAEWELGMSTVPLANP
jgi:hypothetical protein